MGIGNRNSQHSFAQIPAVHQARSVFDRSYPVKDTYNFDYLNPVFVEEVLPGDTINLNVKSFFRLAPQVVPLMDNMYIDWFFFFVPNRLVWNNWERFNGAQDDPDDSTDFLTPQVNLNTIPATNALFGHMGVPSGGTGSVVNSILAFPARAYNLIWNEWFRDQNLQNSLTVPKGDGPDSNGLYVLQKRAKKHDYFTSALPWPQKGDPIGMQLTGEGFVVPDGPDPVIPMFKVVGFPKVPDQRLLYAVDAPGNIRVDNTAPFGPGNLAWSKPNLKMDLTSVEIMINEFREAIMLQSILELDARGGTRYTEILRAHFGVISPDARLQRPEYLSGGTTFINQHPVAQTSQSTDESPQANLASFSTAGERGTAIGFNKSFVEHGFVIGLMQARGDVSYQQGVNRMWFRRTRWDYFWPKLQELGEQEVLNKEIFADGSSADDQVFGYQERFAEYRYHPAEIRGQFRSDYAQSLDAWHLAQNFSARPSLNAAFIESNTPIGRNLVVPDPSYPALLADIWFDLKHVRPMMVYGVPATLGRF